MKNYSIKHDISRSKLSSSFSMEPILVNCHTDKDFNPLFLRSPWQSSRRFLTSQCCEKKHVLITIVCFAYCQGFGPACWLKHGLSVGEWVSPPTQFSVDAATVWSTSITSAARRMNDRLIVLHLQWGKFRRFIASGMLDRWLMKSSRQQPKLTV